MKKVDWEYVASELIDVMMLMEEKEQVIERLLDLMSEVQLLHTGWFSKEEINEVIEYNKQGYSYFD